MKPFPHLPLLLAAAFAIGCSGPAKHTLSDFTTEVYTPAHASGFDIRGTEKDASTLITIRKPWQDAATAEQYLLVLRDDAEAPSDFEGQIVKAPVRRVVCMSSSHVAMFDAVGQVRRGDKYLRDDVVVLGEELVVKIHKLTLTDGGRGLLCRHVRRARAETQLPHAHSYRAGGDKDYLMPGIF